MEYRFAQLPFVYMRCSEEAKKQCDYMFSVIWNHYAAILQEFLDTYSSTFLRETELIRQAVSVIGANIRDYSQCSSQIDNNIIPSLYTILESADNMHEIEDECRDLSLTRSGLFTLYDRRAGLMCHDSINPLWEAWVYANEIERENVDKYIFIGVGLGYYPVQVWECSQKSADIYVFDLDETRFDDAFKYGVLGQIDSDKLHIVTNSNADALFIDAVKLVESEEDIHLSIHQWMLDYFSDEIKTSVTDFVENQKMANHYKHLYEINYNKNKKRFAKDITEFIENKKTEGTKEWIVVAAGPSLNDNIEFIKAKRNEVNVIAIDATLKRLLANDIIPDYITILDPNPNVMHYLTGVEEQTKNIPLLAENLAYWEYVEKYQGEVIRIIANDYPKCIDYADANGLECWTVGGTVSSLAIEIAVKMGGDTIHLVGLDLSFPSNRKYAEGISTQQNTNASGQLSIRSNDCDIVETTYNFYRFQREIEQQISRYPYIRFINKSDKGAYIAGCITNNWWEKEKLITDDSCEYIVRLKEDDFLMIEEKYYLFRQFLLKNTSPIQDIVYACWDSIVNQFFLAEEMHYNQIKSDKKLVIMMVSYFSDIQDEYSAMILEDAYTILSQTDNNVLIVNTMEMTGGKMVAVENPIILNNSEMLKDAHYVVYMGEKIPYYQFGLPLPSRDAIKEFIDFIYKNMPERIICYDRFSVLASICAQVVKVVYK